MTQSPQPQLSAPLSNRLRARRARLVWWWTTRKLPFLKRAIDITLVLAALLLLAPLFALVALAIKLHDRGPVLFWQQRVGLHGKTFKFPKFRSMCVNAEAVRQALLAKNQHGSDGVTFKMKRDPRITPIGRLIRRTSIDELPQLWCVLTGEMSLVGPRPPLVDEVARYSVMERQRLTVTPGLTCIWQVSGRCTIPFEEWMRMDVRYLQHRRPLKDLELLWRTAGAVISGKGAR